MAVTISPSINFTAVETLETGVDAVSAPSISHNAFNLNSVTLNSTSLAPVTTVSYQNYAFTAGAFTIDLTALLGANDEVQTASGLKLQTIIISNPTGNSAITVTTGATNGFPLFGGTNSVVIPAGATLAFYVPEGITDVAAGDKDIDVSGTGSEIFKVGICLG